MTIHADTFSQKSTIVRFFEESVTAELSPLWGRRRRRPYREPVIRALRHGDVRLIESMSTRLSARSLAQRFFVGTPTIPRALLRQLEAVDHDANEAVIALAHGHAIGLAQYVRSPCSTSAELAVIVADVWQGNGIGRMLVGRLAELAASRGITTFRASVLPDNQPARKAVSRLWPEAPGTESDDSIDYELPLSRVAAARAS